MMSDDANAAQIEYWNEVSGPKWVAMQEDLDKQLDPLQDALIEFVNAEEGDSILDVGCGCGGSSLAFARIVGKDGRVDGLDISQPMLSHAQSRVNELGLENVTFRQGDAQVEMLDAASYDFVVSRFGIMFFDDPAAAFPNLKSALKPGGSLNFICWRPARENPWMTVPMMGAAKHVDMPPPPEPNAPGPFALSDADWTRGLLTDAGFGDVIIEPYDAVLHVGPGGTLDASVDFATKIGPVSSILKDADAETMEKVKASMREALKPFETEDGVKLAFAAWLVRAR
ncbi:MAG: class I SAM-dependent methyltransferase [Candidatus Hydrogenedentota bacterium]